MKTTKIDETYFNGSQSVNFKGIYKMNENKIKLSIKKDSYDKQSYARAYVFDKNTLNWNLLDYIPYSQMQVNLKEVFCYRKADSLSFAEKMAFFDDIKTLKNKAKNILI